MRHADHFRHNPGKSTSADFPIRISAAYLVCRIGVALRPVSCTESATQYISIQTHSVYEPKMTYLNVTYSVS